MKLSIIIPVYNVEKYLRKCLNSCLDQNISTDEYEIICVNDGSPDGCGDILDEYAFNYRNITVLNQRNQGLSVARNTGLSYAQGEYVWFIDSDDWIESNVLKEIVQRIDDERNKGKIVDTIQVGFRFTYEDSSKTLKKTFSNWDGCITGIDYMSMPLIPIGAQFNIYRKNLLLVNELWFKPGILYEDVEFKPRVLHFCKNCLCIKETVYNYLQRTTGSIMNHFKYKNGLDIITVMLSLYDFSNKYSLKGEELKYFNKRIAMSMNVLIRRSKGLSTIEKRNLSEELNIYKKIFKSIAKSSILLYKIEGCLLWIAPKSIFILLTRVL